jgi:hypothetical protein
VSEMQSHSIIVQYFRSVEVAQNQGVRLVLKKGAPSDKSTQVTSRQSGMAVDVLTELLL